MLLLPEMKLRYLPTNIHEETKELCFFSVNDVGLLDRLVIQAYVKVCNEKICPLCAQNVRKRLNPFSEFSKS